MKIYRFLTLLFFAVVLLNSCDVIDKPYEEKVVPVEIDSAKVRKVLLEDYTGFQCQNCPDAVVVINELHEIYGDKMVVIAVHAGYFSYPTEAPFTYKFSNEVSEAWFSFFGITNNPIGLINRQAFETKKHKIGTGAWTEKVSAALKLTTNTRINITPAYNAIDSIITANIKVTYNSGTDRKQSLSVVLVQDSIIDAQNVNGKTVTDYVHNHVLRAAFNNTWGEGLNTSAIADSTVIIKKYDLRINKDEVHPWEVKHLKIIAFVYDTETHEVMQVEEVHVTK